MIFSRIKKTFFLVAFIAVTLFGKSQSKQEIDSVLNLIKNEKVTSSQITHYSNFIDYYYYTGGDTYKAFQTFDSAFLETVKPTIKNDHLLISKISNCEVLRSSRRFDDCKKGLNNLIKEEKDKKSYFYFRALEEIAELYHDLSNNDSTFYFANLILNSKDSALTNNQRAHAHYMLSVVNEHKGYYNIAANNLLKADSLVESSYSKATMYIGLTNIYTRLKKYDKAREYVKKALKISKELNIQEQIQFHNYYWARVESEAKQFAISDSLCAVANEYYKKNGAIYMGYHTDVLVARNAYETQNYSKSKRLFSSCLKLALTLFRDTSNAIEISEKLAQISLKNNDLNQAKKHIDSTNNLIQLYDNQNNLLKINFLDMETIYFIKTNQTDKALFALNRKDSLEDEFNKSSNLTDIEELEILHETQLKENQNKLLVAENSKIEQEKRSQFYQLLLGIVFLTLGLIVLYLLFKNRQKKNEKLKELDSLKSKFFESISHELRTPLTLIQLPVSKALEEDDSIPKKDLKTIKYNAKRLQNLMDDLLSITRIEANKYPLQFTQNNITKQAAVLSAQFDSLAESNNIQYVKNIQSKNYSANYDKEVFNKVLINLISNAIKYSNNSGTVEVNFKVENNKAILSVSDEGRGIKKEDQKYIFDKFYRVDQNNENIPGSGIGLSIVKELIGIIGGTISFESEEGKGTQFHVQFPLEEVQELESNENEVIIPVVKPPIPRILESSKEEFAIDNSDKPHLLVVEDNEELLSYIKEQFSEAYKVYTASNGKLGIEQGIEIVPDLIISDWLMPEKNGIELCQAIKENEITSHVPVIMLTAKTEVEDKVKGFETGADAYVAKPFEMNVLKAQVKNIIEQRQKLIEKFNMDGSAVSTNEFSENDMKFWNKFKKLVDDNISNPDFSVQTLADNMFVSRMQLNRKIKALIKISGKEYLVKQKMNIAKQLLLNRDLQISEIAFQVGYDNLNSFSRAFKNETGQSPSDFRKNG
ncbi:MAG: ATP-binding protein [Flavobacteriales bacterium]